MLPSRFFCPTAALNFSPLSVTTIRLLPPSSFVRLALEQNKLQNFAVRTGLEPATPGVTGRYSNQLNYRTIVQAMFEPMEGIEPTTPRLQITCSGQLSYIGNILSHFFEWGCKDITFF